MRRESIALLPAAGVWLAASCGTPLPQENYVREPAASGGRAPLPVPSSGGAEGGAPPEGGAQGGEAPLAGAGPSGGRTEGGGGRSGAGGAAAGSGGAVSIAECPRPPVSDEAFSRRALRGAAAACMEWASCEFEVAARDLQSELGREPADSTAAERAWRTAMVSWSRIELMQFGPTASPSEAQGRDIYQGQGLRDLIYAWPQVSRCRVDEQVVGKKYETLGMSSVSISGRGLFGLETLLFYQPLDTECAASSMAAETWSTLSAEQLQAARLAYARALSNDVHERAVALEQVWAPATANFRADFLEATGYPSEQEAMNVLGWALLYLEREVKDYKLGIPAGYTVGAPVRQAEALYSDLGTELLRANLAGFRDIFQGCAAENGGLGFDDWLVAAGHGELSSDILAATDAAQATLAALPAFSKLSATELEQAYRAIKAITDLLKSDLFGAGSPLNLKLPASVEGDTD